ncbi:MAG: hypothetical protein EP343_25070 [Deltaproteobacteria bacterium]|nr:MAG: hypothetical protein EP343_25070 [Deltaproteobacteria bacterium]
MIRLVETSVDEHPDALAQDDEWQRSDQRLTLVSQVALDLDVTLSDEQKQNALAPLDARPDRSS